ncbi:hypothetical protein RJ639_002953 [Escallonia herrerae]|uniref:Uncharacterized protein n=1 Tax=Escallonia herrerae TaxID=1293975 RepID=A0AA89AWQ9_9ASTE|nr:hypothetical protein RJ639_002953 [Escallonia herrerae]
MRLDELEVESHLCTLEKKVIMLLMEIEDLIEIGSPTSPGERCSGAKTSRSKSRSSKKSWLFVRVSLQEPRVRVVSRTALRQHCPHYAKKSKEDAAKGKKSKKWRGLLYTAMVVAGKSLEALVDTGATHNFISPKVVEELRLKPSKDGSWYKAVNTNWQRNRGVFKYVSMRIGGWTFTKEKEKMLIY